MDAFSASAKEKMEKPGTKSKVASKNYHKIDKSLKKKDKRIKHLMIPRPKVEKPKIEKKPVEKKIIDRSGFFKCDYVAEDNPEKALVLVDKQILIVWGYTKTKKLKTFIDTLRAKNIPLLIYSVTEIDKEDMSIIRAYSFSEIANSPLRLMNLMFNIVALLPYEKR